MAGGKPRQIQADGLERDGNPVPRAMLREVFGDGKWRTIHDMDVALGDRIPDWLADRAMLGKPGMAKKTLEQRIKSGRNYFIRETVNAAVHSKVFEARKRGKKREYRCIRPLPSRVRVGTKLSPTAMAEPSAGTQYGVSRQHVYQTIMENPGCTVDFLITKLMPCMIDAKIIRRYISETVRRSKDKRRTNKVVTRAELAASYAADPDPFLAEARKYVVRLVISNLKNDHPVIEERTFRIAEKK
jgi:hypothetical protein